MRPTYPAIFLMGLGLVACTETITTIVPGEPAEAPDAAAQATSEPEPGDPPPPDAGKPSKKDAGAPPPSNDAGTPPPWQPPSTITGIGRTVAECNGVGRVYHYGPSQPTRQWDVRTALVFGTDAVSGRGNKVFGYTRPSIDRSTLPLVGTAGEVQVKLAIASSSPTLQPGAQYQGLLALSAWNTAENKWSDIAGATGGAALVFVESFTADETAWYDGHLCAGKIAGRVESLVDGTGATRLDFYFVAPLLTPSFPK